jgi:hypothetical protein
MIRQPQIVVGTEKEHLAAVKDDPVRLFPLQKTHGSEQALFAQCLKFVVE